MEREIKKELIRWKDNPMRMPLILRGARQVGKSWLVENFGKENFENTIIGNFEKNKELHHCFQSLDPALIVQRLELLYNQTIIPGKTLLFLDEIQGCPQAIMALRYFKEELPALHVIAAGSLLEFITKDENFSFPVGRVQFLYLSPLTFVEFLHALGEHKLAEYLDRITFSDPPIGAIHNKLLGMVKKYWLIGGMPEAISAYLLNQSFLAARHIQDAILQTYQSDFGKYAPHTQHRYLAKLFDIAPTIAALDFKYSKIDPDVSNPSKVFRTALEQLQKAGILNRIYATSGNGLPLKAEVNEKKFKILFLDIGLMQRSLGVNAEEIFNEEWFPVNSGNLAEQFVGQELLGYSDCYRQKELFYWETDKPGGSAEVDYLISVNNQVVPIEVKSGKTGRLKSISYFMDIKGQSCGIQISQGELKIEKKILTIPFYLISQISRLVKESRNYFGFAVNKA